MLSKTIAEDEALNRLSKEAHLFYLQVIPHLDRDGLVGGRPLLLWSRALPLRVEFMDVAGPLIDEWVQQGLVVRYPGAKGDPVLFFKGFRRHNQKIYYTEEAPSIFPPPPGWRRTAQGLVPEDADLRLALADEFDVRSAYRAALLDPDRFDRVCQGKAKAGHNSASNRPATGQQAAFQDQDQGQDHYGRGGDQPITGLPSTGSGNGGVQGGDAPWAPSHLTQFADDMLRRAAVELGPLVFGSDFRGYGGFVAGAEMATLVRLLEWIAYFCERGDQTEGIRELPAYVRACVNRGDRPGLTTKMQAWLVEQVLKVQEV
jgi:hypothetical protein